MKDEFQIRVSPEMLVADDTHVRVSAEDALPLLCDQNRIARNSPDYMKMEAAVDKAAQFLAPVIVTPVSNVIGERRLMTYNRQRNCAGNIEQSLCDYVRWTALYESMALSGVELQAALLDEGSANMSFPRDHYFKIGHTAFFPDLAFFASRQWIMAHDGIHTEPIEPHLAEHRHMTAQVQGAGLNVVMIERLHFYGCDIIVDPLEQILFLGYSDREGYPEDEDRDAFRYAILEHENKRFHISPIHRDRPGSHHYLDVGCSPALPNNKFLVSTTLGESAGKQDEGYRKLRNYFGAAQGYSPKARKLDADRLIPVQQAQAVQELITNLETVGDTAFMTSCPDALRAKLEKAGVQVNAPESETTYLKPRVIGKGGVHALTNSL